MKIKHVVILAGEKDAIETIYCCFAKTLMLIGDYSILELIIRQLKKYKFERVTLAVGHKANLIKSFFGNGENFGINIDYVHENLNNGTFTSFK